MIYIKAEVKCDGFKRTTGIYPPNEYCESKCEISLVLCRMSTDISIGEHSHNIPTMHYDVAEHPEGWQIYLGEVDRGYRYCMTLCPDCNKRMHEEEEQRSKLRRRG